MKKISILLTGLDLGNNIGKNLEEFNKDNENKKPENKEEAKEGLTIEEDDIPIVPGIEMAQEQNVAIPASVLKVLVEAAQAAKGKSKSPETDENKLASVLESLGAAIENMGDGTKMIGRRPVHTYQIDKDDVLETPVMFFAGGVSYCIWDDRRRGITVKTPYERPFKFKVIQRTIDKSASRNPQYKTLSVIAVSSKKEVEWLREHTLYGVQFHEMRNAATDLNMEMQDSLISAHNMVSSMEDMTVMQRCATANIKIDTTDMSILRRKLTREIAKSIFASSQKGRKSAIQNLEEAIKNEIPVATQTY